MKSSSLIKNQILGLLKSKKLSQKEAAQKLQITPITLNRYLNGETELRSDSLIGLLEILGLDLSGLLHLELLKLTNAADHATQSEVSPSELLFKILLSLDNDTRRVFADFIEMLLQSRADESLIRQLNLRKNLKIEGR